ncbi:MAG TPA: hypothetical protein VN886_13200 [Acidimicrobiales bacterium]|nr:hypothetical protein [Acidimicrobiales bacterium]
MGEFVRPPARRYSWPTATPGNTIAMRHGAWSPRRIDPRAQELVDAIAPGVTWWQPCDWPAVWAWARIEARVELLTEWLADKGGDLDADDTVRPAADLLTRLTVQAANMRARLGLDPLSRARLGRDTAAASVDLARLWAADDDEAS